MKESLPVLLKKNLQHIPIGKYEITNYSGDDNDTIISSSHITVEMDNQSKGQMEDFPLFTGIELLFYRFLGSKVYSRHEAFEHVIEINYCQDGSMGWNMNNGTNIYLGAGDLSIHSMTRCANSELTFPLHYYNGVSITIDITRITTTLPEILKEAGVSGQNLYQKFCALPKPVFVQQNNKVIQIFNDLYNAPCTMKTAYYKLKVQELIILLLSMDVCEEKIVNPYYEQQVNLINEIHSLLTQNLEQYFTIDELSKKFFINTSALKETFKSVYGAPIASYMKEYRMKKAMELLRTTDYHISEIANNVGYQSQSKFTAAFKDITNLLPSEYRRLNR